jgi:hypothetical protein
MEVLVICSTFVLFFFLPFFPYYFIKNRIGKNQGFKKSKVAERVKVSIKGKSDQTSLAICPFWLSHGSTKSFSASD